MPKKHRKQKKGSKRRSDEDSPTYYEVSDSTPEPTDNLEFNNTGSYNRDVRAEYESNSIIGQGSHSRFESGTNSIDHQTRSDFISLDSGPNDLEETFIPLEEDKPVLSRQERRREEREQAKQTSNNPPSSNDTRYNFCYPWMDSMASIFRGQEVHCYDLFHQEFNLFLKYISPRVDETKLREKVVKEIRYAINDRWDDAEVDVFGSFATGLFISSSDVDLVISFSRMSPRIDAVASQLIESGICIRKDVTVIRHAKVPVIKIEERYSGLKVDIVLNTTNGVTTAKLINKELKQYPAARPIILFLKHYLAMRELNEVFTGGLGGYAIFALVVSFLQMHPLVSTGQIDPMENLSVLLLDFMEMYGHQFRMGSVGIDSKNKAYYSKGYNERARNGTHVYNIIDPQDPHNDIGQKSYKSEDVADKFHDTYISMKERMKELEKELKANNYTGLSPSRVSSFKNFSILSICICITPQYIMQRSRMLKAYSQYFS
ncbi:hypothetical protein BY458DRAFT_455252 [Sporodiniella umbellata]|nr:hypothetical protein BY458DRAFT_455252 [Sporodiniella umbellata]